MVEMCLDGQLNSLPLRMHGFVYPRSRLKLPAMPLSCGHERQTNPAGYSLDGMARGDHEFFIFQYTLAGRGGLEFDGKVRFLTPGEAMLVRIPHCHRYFLPDDSPGWEFVYLCIHGGQANSVLREIQDAAGAVLNLSGGCRRSLASLMRILRVAFGEEETSAFQASALAYEFVMGLADDVLQAGGQREWSVPTEKAVAFAHRRFRQGIGVEDLAGVAGLSRSYFTRRFTREVGVSPHQYLMDLRVREAARLLLQSDATLEGIAMNVGFCDGNHLCKSFKAATGMTPGAFRRRG